MYVRTVYVLGKKTILQWWNRDPFTQSAAIAYYTIFSFPAIMILYFSFASLFVEQENMQAQTQHFMVGTFGENAASQFQEIIHHTAPEQSSILTFILGFSLLFLAALRLFMQFQKVLNNIWGFAPNHKEGIGELLLRRLVSFSVMLLTAIILLSSLFLSTALNWVAPVLESYLPDYVPLIMKFFYLLVSFSLITLLFAVILKLLPDRPVPWACAIRGAVLSAALFLPGQYLLGFYFGVMRPASSYGVTGSIILLMLWVSYSSLILLLGAEFSNILYKNHNSQNDC